MNMTDSLMKLYARSVLELNGFTLQITCSMRIELEDAIMICKAGYEDKKTIVMDITTLLKKNY